ncbi:hypothetical protein FRC02_006562 [Tulasnella sp. 418]|nr:hypothetical protein FRC02_006562 [Tulasnella sp. 418]
MTTPPADLPPNLTDPDADYLSPSSPVEESDAAILSPEEPHPIPGITAPVRCTWNFIFYRNKIIDIDTGALI